MHTADRTVDSLTALTPHLWAIAIVFFGIGDLLTTAIGLSAGRTVEIGPLASVAYHDFGLLVLIPLKLGTLLGAYLLWLLTPTPHNTGVPLGLAALGVLVTLWNASILVAVL